MGNMLSRPNLRVVCAKGRKPSRRRTPPGEMSNGEQVLSVPNGDPVPYAVPLLQDVAGDGPTLADLQRPAAGPSSVPAPQAVPPLRDVAAAGPRALTDVQGPAAAGPSSAPAPHALVELARKGDVKALVALLDRHGTVPVLGGLLHAASEEGHEHVIDVLLMAGVSAAETDEDGQTALHVAVANGHVEAAERLSRADPCLEMSVLDNYLMTPLHLACEDGLPDMVAMLLSRGGDTLVTARSPQPSPETGSGGKGLVGFSTHAPPQPGPGGTLELTKSGSSGAGSSGGSLLFIAKRHSNDEAADLIRRASHGEKLPLPERLSQRSHGRELSPRSTSLRSNGSTTSSPYSPGSLKSIASGVALEDMTLDGV